MPSPRVVCVDDRQDSLTIRKLLLEQFGCEVIAVTDASDCLTAIQDNSVDLAIIDYHLAGKVNGEQLAHTIRSQYPRLALVMLTGDPKVPDSARESVDVLLIKGASSPRDLLDAIEDLVPNATLRPRPPRFVPPIKSS